MTAPAPALPTPDLDRHVATLRHAMLCPHSRGYERSGECICTRGKVDAQLSALRSAASDAQPLREALSWVKKQMPALAMCDDIGTQKIAANITFMVDAALQGVPVAASAAREAALREAETVAGKHADRWRAISVDAAMTGDSFTITRAVAKEAVALEIKKDIAALRAPEQGAAP